LLSRRRCACAVSWASRASVSLSEITAMERIPSSHIILTPDNRYYTHRWTALFGAGQRFPPTPSAPRLSTGDSRSFFSILLTLPLSDRQQGCGGVAKNRWGPVHTRGLLGDVSSLHIPTQSIQAVQVGGQYRARTNDYNRDPSLDGQQVIAKKVV